MVQGRNGRPTGKKRDHRTDGLNRGEGARNACRATGGALARAKEDDHKGWILVNEKVGIKKKMEMREERE